MFEKPTAELKEDFLPQHVSGKFGALLTNYFPAEVALADGEEHFPR